MCVVLAKNTQSQDIGWGGAQDGREATGRNKGGKEEKGSAIHPKLHILF